MAFVFNFGMFSNTFGFCYIERLLIHCFKMVLWFIEDALLLLDERGVGELGKAPSSRVGGLV